MNKKITISSIVLLIILAAGWLWLSASKEKWSQNQNEQGQSAQRQQASEQDQRTNSDSEEANEQKVLTLLPKEVLLYDLQKNGFNQNKSFYSVNAYISLDAQKRLKKSGISEMDFQKYAGCWVMNLYDNKAYKVAIAAGQDRNFYQWIGNDKIELIGDEKKTATTYSVITGDVISTRTFNLDNRADISGWKAYQNSEENFEVKYPAGVVIQEKHENFISDTINRYVSFYDPETDATIYLGVKQKSENNIMSKPYRTGIPGGDFLIKGEIAFGNGLAQESRLVNCDFPGENHCAVELIWFCGSGDFGSNNFDLDSNTSAFMEVVLTEKSNVDDVTKLVHGIIRSFRIL